MSEQGKIRIVVVEAEGAALTEAVRLLSSRILGGGVAESPAVAPVAAPAALPAAPAPRSRRPVKYRRSQSASIEAPATMPDKGALEGKGAIRNAIRAAVAESPRTNAEVRDAVRRMGLDLDSTQVGNSLCQLRLANEIYKDEDLKWRLASARTK